MRRSKRFKQIDKQLEETDDIFNITDAIEHLKKCPSLKFDETIELSFKMGVDPKKADQQVRGLVSLPHGTGKKVKVLVLAKGDKSDEAKAAKADFVGSEEFIEKIKGGWTGFDVIVVTPDMMRDVGKLGKVLGPKGLMPSPKAGTVTMDVGKAVSELKKGKIEFKVDKSSLINSIIGKMSFKTEALLENIKAFLIALNRAKPSGAKGIYIKSLFLSSTMGPGFKIKISSIEA